MADVLHDVSNAVGSATATATLNIPLTIAANADRYLIAHLFQSQSSGGQPVQPTSVTWSGQALSKLWEFDAFGNQRIEAWGLKNPNAGAGNVTFNVASNANKRMVAQASAYYNVNQTTPTSAPFTAANVLTSTPRYVVGQGLGPGDRAIGAAAAHASTAININPASALPTFSVAGTPSQSASAATITPAIISVANRIAGQMHYAVVGTKNNEVHSCATPGWFKVDQYTHPSTALTFSLWAFKQVEAATPPAAPVVTWTTAVACFGQCFGIADVDFDNLPIQLGSPNNGNASPHTSSGGVTAVANTLALYLDVCNINTAVAQPGGWTEQDDSALSTAVMRFALGTKTVAVAGAASGAISIVAGVADWLQVQLGFGVASVFTERSDIQAGTGALFVAMNVGDDLGAATPVMGFSSIAGTNLAGSLGGIALIAAASVVTITAPLHTNAAAFYGPKLNIKYTASFHQNTQSYPTQKIIRGLNAPFYQNTQVFYAAKIRRTIKLGALYQNTQVFYGPAIIVAVPANIIKPPLHTNAQEFYAPSITFAGKISAPFHQNTQVFYGPAIKRAYTVSLAGSHQNLQQFYGPTIFIYVPPEPIVLDAPFHQNAQAFFGPTIFVAPQTHFRAPFHQNQQVFYGPYINIKPRPPDGGAKGAIGPGWWSKGIKPDRIKARHEEKNIWILPKAADLPPVVYSPPVVITPANARNMALQRKQMLDELKAAGKRYAARERIIEDRIVMEIVRAIVEE